MLNPTTVIIIVLSLGKLNGRKKNVQEIDDKIFLFCFIMRVKCKLREHSSFMSYSLNHFNIAWDFLVSKA